MDSIQILESDVKTLKLDEISLHSPWPKRLLGIEHWDLRLKSEAEILREYDKEKWEPLLEYLSHHPSSGLKDIINIELGKKREIAISDGKNLCLMDIYDAHHRYLMLVSEIISQYLPASAIVELGAGTGELIFYLDSLLLNNGCELIAADFCPNAVRLMQLLSKREKISIRTGICDFGKNPITAMDIPQGAVIFTSYAVSCIPNLEKDFVEALSLFKPKAVIHFEPCYEHCQDSDLLNLMRRRYIEVNDYNKNLITILDDAVNNGSIKYLSINPLVYGINPFFSASCLIWAPN